MKRGWLRGPRRGFGLAPMQDTQRMHEPLSQSLALEANHGTFCTLPRESQQGGTVAASDGRKRGSPCPPISGTPCVLNNIPQERQERQLCLRSTLNALLGGPRVTKSELDALADSLTAPTAFLFSPHRTPVLGNYDVTTLEACCTARGLVSSGVLEGVDR